MAICQNCGNFLNTTTKTVSLYTWNPLTTTNKDGTAEVAGTPATRTKHLLACVICGYPATVLVTPT